MRIAIIDLGTNTCNLLISDIHEDKTSSLVFKDKAIVKLGEGGIAENEISPEAYQRGLDALQKHLKTINKHKVEKIYAFATSATRSAKNGAEFVAEVFKKFGLKINVIDGDKEAELIYLGVKQAAKIDKLCLIMDIGGGSTEFIIADKNKLHWKKSYDLGVARLLAKFNPNDPITETEIETVKSYLLEEVKDLLFVAKQNRITHLIGSSGSFDSLAAIITKAKYPEINLKNQTEYTFRMDDYKEVYQQLLTSNLQERYKIDGLSKMRAEMIVMAVIFIDLLFEELKINKMQLSTFALKEGALSKVINGVY